MVDTRPGGAYARHRTAPRGIRHRDGKERTMNAVIVVRIADTLPCEAAH